MKIRKIQFQNLNSLKGVHTLDFDKRPLKDCGLFVITGNTGAGKSTILDAITLALYGQVPRYDSKTAQEVLSHGTQSCYAEIEFETKEGVYISKWALAKRKTGTWKPTEREVAKIDLVTGERQILGTKVQDCNQKIESILKGLTFSRFVRSVMLAQGDFVAFLKATDERSAILERITDSKKYSEISKAAHFRHKEAQEILEKEQAQLASVEVLSFEEKELLKEALQADEADQEKIVLEVEEWEVRLKKMEQWEELEREAKQLMEQLLVLEQKKADYQVGFERLKQHQKAIVFETRLNELNRWEIDKKAAAEHLENIGKQQEELKAEKAEITIAVDLLQKAQQEWKEDWQAFEKIQQQVLQLDMSIGHQRTWCTTKVKEQQKLVVELEDQAEKGQLLNAQLVDLEKRIGKATAWLEEHQQYAVLAEEEMVATFKNSYQQLLQQQKQIEKKEEQQKELKAKWEANKKQETKWKLEQSDQARELQKLEQHYLKILQDNGVDTEMEQPAVLEWTNQNKQLLAEQEVALIKASGLFVEQQHIVEQLWQIEEEISSKNILLELMDRQFLVTSDEMELVKKRKAYYEMILTEQLQKSSLSGHRGNLKEGEECPLCFSTNHPFREQTNIDIDFQLKQAKKDVEQYQKRLSTIETDFYETIGEQKALFKELQQLQLHREKLQEEGLGIETTLRENAVDTIGDLQITLLNKHATKVALEATQEKRQLMEELSQQLQAVFMTWNGLNKDHMHTMEQLKQLERYLIEVGEQQQQLIEEIVEGKQEVAILEGELKGIMTNFGIEGTFVMVIQKLEIIKKQYKKAVEKNQQLLTDKGQLTLQKEHLEKAHTTSEEQLKILLESIGVENQKLEALEEERSAIFGDKIIAEEAVQKKTLGEELELKLEEQQQLQRDKETLLAQLEGQLTIEHKNLALATEKLQELVPEMEKSIKKVGFDSILDLKEQLLEKSYVQELEEKEKQLEQEGILLEDKQKENAHKKATFEKEEVIDVKTKSKLTEKLAVLKEQSSTLLQAIGSKKQQLEQNAGKEKQHQQLLTNIEGLSKEAQKWFKLKALIGSEKGKKFQLFAQSITLQQLVQLANKHLRGFLKGRYYLEKKQLKAIKKITGALLEIDIVDTFQGGNKRPLKTLSGGESFLASLSLALGLSDMSSNEASIESLFIDEGFGTLDADTLVVAIQALQSLQATGKTIGVISHIEQLRNSIDTQIKVMKKGGGFSTIEVI